MSVRETQVQFPDGSLGTYNVVTSGSGLGSIIIPRAHFRGMDCVGLVQLHRFPSGEFSWEFPRGGTSNLESSEAVRELIEETDLVPGLVRRLGTLRPDTGLLDTEVAVWSAQCRAIAERTELENIETSSLYWVSYGKLQSMIRSGQITCGMTLAAYAMLRA